MNNEDIVNTVTKLPRTPNEAGLIEVSLKRKLEYKNPHAQQLIDPRKCFKMLELLKKDIATDKDTLGRASAALQALNRNFGVFLNDQGS